jgi:two-component system phosphate regulon sensor histidine kinase PhoR
MHYNVSVKYLKRYWAPLLAAALIPMLGALAFWQLTWIRDLGERERFRMEQNLWTAANQLGAAFQNELSIIPSVFNLDLPDPAAALAAADWGDFAVRWEAWQAYALEPSIVRAAYLLKLGAPAVGSALFAWRDGGFRPESDSALRADLTRAALLFGDEGRFQIASLTNGDAVYLQALEPTRRFWLLIRIDQAALGRELLPRLAERYLYGTADYYYRVVDQSDGNVVFRSAAAAGDGLFVEPDLRYPLERLDYPTAIAAAEASPPAATEPSGPTEPAGSVEPADVRRGVGNAPALSILRTRRAIFIAQLPMDDSPLQFWEARPPRDALRNTRWLLEAVHRSGSLAAAVRNATIRSSAVSSGILALLAVALLVLAVAARRSQQLAERQREFIASVTHELKTPVAVIHSAADNLSSGVVRDAEKAGRYGEAIAKESLRLGDMVDRLLVYARLGDAGPREMAPVDLARLAERVIEANKAGLHAAQFRVDLMLHEGIVVAGDAAALEMAVGNLVANALKHARDGLFLGVDLRSESRPAGFRRRRDWAVLTIRDRGPGIPRRERRAVFEAFYRGEAARERQLPGSGLGLNLVRRIVAAHGGSLRLETQGELGSAFVIRLPREDNHER